MKKLIALLSVLTVTLGAFTACGSENTESSTSSSSEISESVADSSAESSSAETKETEETTATEEVTDVTEAETTEAETKGTVKSEKTENYEDSEADMSVAGENTETEIENADEYVDAVERLYNSFSSNDINQAMNATFPKSVFDAMTESGMTKMFSDELSGTDFMNGDEVPDFSKIEVVSVRSASSDEIEFAASYYSQIEGLCRTMTEIGVDYDMLMNNEATEEQMTKLNESGYLSQDGNFDIIVDFDEYYYVTYSMNGEEIEMPVFRQSGDDMKIDITIMGLLGTSD